VELVAFHPLSEERGIPGEFLKELGDAAGHYLATFKSGTDVKTIAGELVKTGEVKYAEPNYAFSSFD
jgi:hypothetical protein